jgi:hypothetical protein
MKNEPGNALANSKFHTWPLNAAAPASYEETARTKSGSRNPKEKLF